MGKHSDKGNPLGRIGGPGPKRPLRRKVSRASGSTLGSATARRGVGPGTREKSRRRGPLEQAPARLRAERGRRMARTKRIAAIVGVVALATTLLAGAGAFAYAKHLERTMQRGIDQNTKLDLSLETAGKQEPFNILLLGFDKRSKDKVYRSDTIILGRVDPVSKQVWLLSIPRDTRVQVPGHGTRKANDAYALGEEKLAIKTIEKFTGVPIHHFVGVDFKGFFRAVDAMGGVWVDVPVEINDPQADGTRGKKASRIAPGYQLLDGAHALTFVRTRHTFADQDFGRMRNQQAFFLAVADQVANRTSVAKLPGIISAMAPYISTDMSIMEMMRLAQALQGAGSKRVYTETIGGDWRSPWVVTDEELKSDLMTKFKEGRPFKEPEPSEEETATANAAGDKAEASSKKPADIRLTIRNGAGIAGCAKQASSVLKARAFKVLEVGNAGQFVYDKTLVVYKTDRAAAQKVAEALPPGAKLVESRGMYAFDGDVLVVIGKDWDIARVPVAPINTN